MSSNIRIQKICEYCNHVFTAKTTVTKYCCDACAKKAYKARKRNEKLGITATQYQQTKEMPIEDIKSKEFLSVSDASKLLGISKRTIYRLFDSGKLYRVKLGTRTIINRSQIDSLFEIPEVTIPVYNTNKFNVKDYYSMEGVRSLFNISEKALYSIIKRNNINKIHKPPYVYVLKKDIHNIFGKPQN